MFGIRKIESLPANQLRRKDLLIQRRSAMLLILLIILVIMLAGVQPRWPYSRNWGYYPSGGVGLLLLIVIILLLLGY